jgi:hypothetical protein
LLAAIPALAVALLLSQAARADSIIATGVDSSRGQYGVWISANGADMNTYFAGVILIQLNDGTSIVNRDTLCVDIFTDIYLGQTYGSTVLVPSEVPGKNLDRVSWLVDNALLPTQNNTYTSRLPQFDWVRNSAQGAGIQLAIWDIVEDGGTGFSKGVGKVKAGSSANPTDPQVLYWAKQYEILSASQHSNDAFVYMNVDVGNGNPAQMLEGPEFYVDGGPQPQKSYNGLSATPECPTFLVVGSVMIGLGLLIRRRVPRRAGRIDAAVSTQG